MWNCVSRTRMWNDKYKRVVYIWKHFFFVHIKCVKTLRFVSKTNFKWAINGMCSDFLATIPNDQLVFHLMFSASSMTNDRYIPLEYRSSTQCIDIIFFALLYEREPTNQMLNNLWFILFYVTFETWDFICL